MVFKINKAIIAIILIFLIVIGCGGLYTATRNREAIQSWAAGERPSIIIDAGHGGADGGAVADDGTMEKTLNLDIALRLKEILELAGYQVYMTRTEDVSLCADKFIKKEDMNNRIAIARKYPQALFVSIHLNKFPQTQYSGSQVFYSDNHDNSIRLATCIQESIKENLQPQNTRQVKIGNDNSILLRTIQQPAVIVEGGFLSNSHEFSLLKTEQYRSRLAYCIFIGIVKYRQEKEVN